MRKERFEHYPVRARVRMRSTGKNATPLHVLTIEGWVPRDIDVRRFAAFPRIRVLALRRLQASAQRCSKEHSPGWPWRCAGCVHYVQFVIKTSWQPAEPTASLRL